MTQLRTKQTSTDLPAFDPRQAAGRVGPTPPARATTEALNHCASAGLDYRVDFPAGGEDRPAGFALCVRVKLEIIPEPVTADELAQAPRPLEDLP